VNLAQNKTKPDETPKEEETPAIVEAHYTSHPIENFMVGPYKFEKGLLRLEGDEVDAFDKLHASMPPVEQRRVRKLDVAAAEEFVRQRLEAQSPGATQAFDSSIGERAKPVVGTGKLEDSNANAGDDSTDA